VHGPSIPPLRGYVCCPDTDRPTGRLRYKTRGHITMHVATGEAQVTPREMRLREDVAM
jgi:hypothetical protein